MGVLFRVCSVLCIGVVTLDFVVWNKLNMRTAKHTGEKISYREYIIFT